MSDHPSFCECVYKAKTYRIVKNQDPQCFAVTRPLMAYADYLSSLTVMAPPQRTIVYGTTYAFPWRTMMAEMLAQAYIQYNDPRTIPEDVFIRFWFDENSKELRMAYLRR